MKNFNMWQKSAGLTERKIGKKKPWHSSGFLYLLPTKLLPQSGSISDPNYTECIKSLKSQTQGGEKYFSIKKQQ